MPWPPHLVNSRKFVRLEEAFPPFADSSEPFKQVNLSNNQVYTVVPELRHIKFVVPSGGTATVVFPAQAKYVGKVFVIKTQKSGSEDATLTIRFHDKFLPAGKYYEETFSLDEFGNKSIVLMYTRYGWMILNMFQALVSTVAP